MWLNDDYGKFTVSWASGLQKYLQLTGLPDLEDDGEAYRSFSPSSVVQGMSGQSLSISCDVANNGSDASGAFEVSFYASTNTTIDGADYYLGKKSMASISGSFWEDCDITVAVPTSLPAGEYYVGWIIDSAKTVCEANETNNTAYKTGYRLSVTEPNVKPNTPTLSSPSQGATNQSLTPTLYASTFSDPNAGDTHANSRWQVDNGSSFSSPEWDSGTSYTAGTSTSVPSGELSYSTRYYWRVQYKDNHGAWSSWSSYRYFYTQAEPNVKPNTPTLSSPSQGATNQSLTPTLYASTFSDPNAGDTHANSQWQVDNGSSFSSPEWDSGQ